MRRLRFIGPLALVLSFVASTPVSEAQAVVPAGNQNNVEQLG